MGGAVFPPCYLPVAKWVAQMVKLLPAIWETQVLSLGWEDPLEKELATPSNTLPRKSHGWRSLVGYSQWDHKELDVTEQLHFHFSLSCIGEGNGNPFQCSCLENPRDGGAWWVAPMGSHRVRYNWSDFTAAAAVLWCPLSVPTVLLGFLLPWMWDIASRLLQQSIATAPFLGVG